jgi:hypothetical protein
MKLAVIIPALVMLFASSCVKERTCECTRIDKLDGNREYKEVYTFRSKKKDAKVSCDKYSQDSYAEKVTCELK